MKGKVPNAMFVVTILGLVAVVGIGAVLWTMQQPSTGAVGGLPTPVGATDGVKDYRAICGDDLAGATPLGVQNMADTTASTYLVTSARIYLVSADGTETYKQSSTLGGALTSVSLTCGKKYHVYAAAGSNVSADAIFTVESEDNPAVVLKSATWGGLIYRMYDRDNLGYRWSTTAAADSSGAGTWRPTGMTFYSTSSNTSGPTIGTDGYVRDSLYFETNGSASTTARYNDHKVLACLNGQDLSDWQEPSSVKFVDGTATKVTAIPTKISNDGFDYCWELTRGGASPTISTSPEEIQYEIHAKSGVNPSDDLQWGFFTSGWYKKTLSEDMNLDFYKDDSSNTYVYPATLNLGGAGGFQNVTLNID